MTMSDARSRPPANAKSRVVAAARPNTQILDYLVDGPIARGRDNFWDAYHYRDTLARIEQLVSIAAQEVLGTTKVTFRGAEIDFKPPWRRVKFADALAEHELWTPRRGRLAQAPARPRRRRLA